MRHMHCDIVTPAPLSIKSAVGVPLAAVLTHGCYGCEGGGEVEKMMGEPFTSKLLALICLVCLAYLVCQTDRIDRMSQIN